MDQYHIPVMPTESLKLLNIQPNHWFIDCNLGGGGHTNIILQAGGKVLGIDLDKDAITKVASDHKLNLEDVNGTLLVKSDNLILYQSNFLEIKAVSQKFNITPSGILFDLGVSSFQLEETRRGFSFNLDSPLDMRMNQSDPIPTAKDLVNALHENELSELFWKLGQERFSKRIAKKIVESRKKKTIETTNELARLISSIRPRSKNDRTHPATRVFQALRIAVNDELNSLKEALPSAFEVLSPNGRLVVISFHSLEDRIVKNFFNQLSKDGKASLLTKKPIGPSFEEINSNPRSRSGKLRAIEKIK